MADCKKCGCVLTTHGYAGVCGPCVKKLESENADLRKQLADESREKNRQIERLKLRLRKGVDADANDRRIMAEGLVSAEAREYMLIVTACSEHLGEDGMCECAREHLSTRATLDAEVRELRTEKKATAASMLLMWCQLKDYENDADMGTHAKRVLWGWMLRFLPEAVAARTTEEKPS